MKELSGVRSEERQVDHPEPHRHRVGGELLPAPDAQRPEPEEEVRDDHGQHDGHAVGVLQRRCGLERYHDPDDGPQEGDGHHPGEELPMMVDVSLFHAQAGQKILEDRLPDV